MVLVPETSDMHGPGGHNVVFSLPALGHIIGVSQPSAVEPGDWNGLLCRRGLGCIYIVTRGSLSFSVKYCLVHQGAHGIKVEPPSPGSRVSWCSVHPKAPGSIPHPSH